MDMRILAIGDFHGKFPEKLKKEAGKADIILSAGDYANANKIREIIFKHWTSARWWEVIGEKKAKKLEKESFESGIKVLKELSKINNSVYTIWGNTDFYKDFQTSEPDSLIPGDYDRRIKKMGNIVLVDKKKKKIKGIELIGHGGYVDVTEFIKHPVDKDKKSQKRRLKRYNRTIKKLKKLFISKPEKGFIFLTHYTPYGYFDKVKLKSSPMYNKHVGFESYNKIIKKYKPSLVICGHMHEYQGKKKLGGSWIVNPGAAFQGKAAVIELEGDKVKKIKFIR